MSKDHSALLPADEVAHRWHESPSLASASRVAVVVLVALVLWSENRSQPWVWGVLLAMGSAATFNLWHVSAGRGGSQSELFHHWAAAFFVLVIARGTEGGALLLVLLLHPLAMCTVLQGVRHGFVLGAFAAAAWTVDFNGPGVDHEAALPALALLLVPLIMSAVVRPMAALRQRMQLANELERELDPRRGLQAVGLEAGERLRLATGARRVLVCHWDTEVPTVLVCDADDGSFVASAALSTQTWALLARLSAVPRALRLRSADKPGGRQARAEPPDLRPERALMINLAQLLEAEFVQLVPDAPGQAQTGWIVVAYGTEEERRKGRWPLQPLAGFAIELRRLLQVASYMDHLQDEIAANERSRMGRDLHDSAIQPYLGLKFAIEGLALRCEPGNPLYARFHELRGVCDAELVELRKTVAALRGADDGGEKAMAAALQRQCKRFAKRFEIQVDLQLGTELPASRKLVSALLHMVNEALNNVRRHTQARRVWVSLTHAPGSLRLVIRDDAGQRSGKAAPAFEPRSLAERARELGGALELRRHNGLNTEIRITLPT